MDEKAVLPVRVTWSPGGREGLLEWRGLPMDEKAVSFVRVA